MSTAWQTYRLAAPNCFWADFSHLHHIPEVARAFLIADFIFVLSLGQKLSIKLTFPLQI